MQPKLGIIAGGGALPQVLVKECEQQGRPYFVVALKGQADAHVAGDGPHAWVRLGAAGEALKQLRDNAVSELILAGSVDKPSAAELRPDLWTARFLAKTGAYQLGDDGLLSALIDHLETAEGFRIIGIADLAPHLLVPAGPLTGAAPTAAQQGDMALGFAAAKELGGRDIGQGVVVAAGAVVAREDRSGTDAMLAGLSDGAGTGGVLVKTVKPGQERRADLPAVGPRTVAAAKRAGLGGIALEAGGAIIIEREETVRAADAAGLFIVGMAADTAPAGPEPLIYVIAGEPSADQLGARLMAALKAETAGRVRFAGIGGPAMTGEGLASLFPMDELAVMGLAEVLPRIPELRRRILETVADARGAGPDVLVTIDSPDFNFRVAKRLKGSGFPMVHFVAPSVWAWRPGRAAKVARFLDHLMTLLPFEPPYFEKEGLATTYVGHPVLESGAEAGDGARFREKYGIEPQEKLLLVLPGSRRGEAARHLPVFAEPVAALSRHIDGLRIVTVPASPTREMLTAGVAGWPMEVIVVDDPDEKFDAFAAADAALAASGTVSLELAMADTPAVIAYRMNPVTAWLAKRLVKVRFANLVNLALDRAAIPEYLLEHCNAGELAPAVATLLEDPAAGQAQRDAYAEALAILGREAEPPSRRAARAVLQVMARTENGAG